MHFRPFKTNAGDMFILTTDLKVGDMRGGYAIPMDEISISMLEGACWPRRNQET